MARAVIVTCAVTGSGDTVSRSDKVPVTPAEIAAAAIDAGKAGASICHIHVRDPETGKPSMETALYADVVGRIRDSDSDIVLNLTTGPGARYMPSREDPGVNCLPLGMRLPRERTRHVEALRPELCSLDVATLNFGETAFVNVLGQLRIMAGRMRDSGARPELEIFDAGHARLAARMIEDGLIASPPLFQLCLGVPWGAPATPQTLAYMRGLLPDDAIWAGFGIARQQMPMVAEIVNLGGHVRVGLEDNLYLERGVLATNAQLVDRAAAIVAMMGARVAEPAETRALLGLRGSQ